MRTLSHSHEGLPNKSRSDSKRAVLSVMLRIVFLDCLLVQASKTSQPGSAMPAIKLTKVDSKSIQGMSYDEPRGDLFIQFVGSDDIYVYSGVPTFVYVALQT